jgi:MYXO-CTERM domain-containing protein
MVKTSAVLLVVLAAWSMPCAAVIHDGYRGVFSDAGSFSAAARDADVLPPAPPEREPQGGALVFAALGLLALVARRRWLALRVDD